MIDLNCGFLAAYVNSANAIPWPNDGVFDHCECAAVVVAAPFFVAANDGDELTLQRSEIVPHGSNGYLVEALALQISKG